MVREKSLLGRRPAPAASQSPLYALGKARHDGYRRAQRTQVHNPSKETVQVGPAQYAVHFASSDLCVAAPPPRALALHSHGTLLIAPQVSLRAHQRMSAAF